MMEHATVAPLVLWGLAGVVLFLELRFQVRKEAEWVPQDILWTLVLAVFWALPLFFLLTDYLATGGR